jgi:tetratricopeptide (TPR) repeat protein
MQHIEDKPSDAIVFAKLGDDTWGFEFPRSYDRLMEQLWDLQESNAPDSELKLKLSHMLEITPELFDAASMLAEVYRRKRQPALARSTFETAVAIARKFIPDSFVHGQDRIIWAYLENRPFLRLLHGYAQFVEQSDGIKQAIPLYEEILRYNPNDNQGTRAVLATAYINTDQPQQAVQLASLYPRDIIPDLVMGSVLGMFKLGRTADAKKQLQTNREYQQHVIKELLKPAHVQPITLRDDYVTTGGSDEAYLYWQTQGQAWQDTPGALEFLAAAAPDIRAAVAGAAAPNANDVLAVDIFNDFLAFLSRVDERPIKLTATGNLSLKDLEPLLSQFKTIGSSWQTAVAENCRPRSEEDISVLRMIRVLAQDLHLTRKQHDKLLSTKAGHSFLHLDPVNQYQQMVLVYWKEVNWAYFTAHTQAQSDLAQAIQRQQIHIWTLLAAKGADWIDYADFCQLLRKDLHLEPYLKQYYTSPEVALSSGISVILLHFNLALFGCVELETKPGKHSWSEEVVRFRSTQLGLYLYSVAGA